MLWQILCFGLRRGRYWAEGISYFYFFNQISIFSSLDVRFPKICWVLEVVQGVQHKHAKTHDKNRPQLKRQLARTTHCIFSKSLYANSPKERNSTGGFNPGELGLGIALCQHQSDDSEQTELCNSRRIENWHLLVAPCGFFFFRMCRNTQLWLRALCDVTKSTEDDGHCWYPGGGLVSVSFQHRAERSKLQQRRTDHSVRFYENYGSCASHP